MNRAITHFQINLNSARQLGVLYQAFDGKLTVLLPLDELLRAEIVLAVSALDCYVHDIVRIRMKNMLLEKNELAKSSMQFGASLKFVKSILQAGTIEDQVELFELEVRRLHAFKTFQRADAISEALNMIGIKSIWKKISPKFGKSASDVKAELDLIIDRRNKIAHEGDMDPSSGFTSKFPIEFESARSVLSFLEKVATEIDCVVLRESCG